MRLREHLRLREGWAVFLLTLGLTMVTSLAVASAGWTEGLTIVPLAGLGAFVIGLMIAKSILPGWVGHMFSVIIGFAWSFWLVTSLFPDYYPWEFRWAWLWWYIYQWTLTVFSGGVSRNNLIFILQMSFIVWLATYLTVWFVFRARRVWLAIVPCGALLLINLVYAPKDITSYMLTYLGLALLLVIRFNIFRQQQIWRLAHVHFNADEVSFDFLRAGALFTVVILIVAWVTPTVGAAQETSLLEALRGPWRDMQAEWSRLFASLNYRPGAAVDFYGGEMTLGGPRELAEVPVLAIRAPTNARYWRAVVFDEYTGRGWENNDETMVPFGAENEAIPMVSYQARQAITQTVTLLGPSMSMLPIAAQPTWVDQPARANLSYVSVPAVRGSGGVDEGGVSQRVETISYVRSRTPLDAGDRYVGTASLSTAGVGQLRRAGTAYPAWVLERYTQLPDTVPDRVKELAATLAAPFDNAYDKASAIESYLRNEIDYNEKIEAPPPDRDPVDYVVFDLKQGYCDYYATSMAVMLRSLGIPARVVSGYAQGQYDPAREAYVVLLQDAHTWVEVFFPAYGWVEFEPTAAQPLIVRPPDPPEGGAANLGPDAATPPPENPLDDQSGLLDEELPSDLGTQNAPWWILNPTRPGSWLLGGLALLILAGVTVLLMGSRRAARLGGVGAIYQNMLRLARWAGASVRPSLTPLEHAAALGEVVPEGERPARRIAGLYTREKYGQRPAGEQEQRRVSEAWRELRPRLVRQTIVRQVTRRVPIRLRRLRL